MDTFRISFFANFNILNLIFLIITFHSLHISLGYQFPSVVTFNEDYITKSTRLKPKDSSSIESGSSDLNIPLKNARSSSISSLEESSHADNILPICCSMETDDVMFFECQNTLSVSSKETVFKQKTWIAPKHLVSSKVATKFKFENSFLKCSPRGFTASLSLNSSIARVAGNYFLPDGYLKHRNEYYRPDEYCISGLNKERVEVQICPVNCKDPLTPCIQKCCGRDQIYSFGYGDHPRGCVDLGPKRTKWYPTLYHDLETKLKSEELIQLNPHIIQKFPTSFKFNCRFNKTTVFPNGKEIARFLSSFTKKPFRNLEFRLRKDGWLLYPNKQNDENGLETPEAKLIENYCIDGAQDYGESTPFTNTESKTILFLCSGGVEEGKLKQRLDIKIKRRPSVFSQNSTTSLPTSTTAKAKMTAPVPIITTTSNSLPETTTKIAETSTKIPETSTKIPEISTKIPETSTKLAETSTKIPETSTKLAEATIKIEEIITYVPPMTTTVPSVPVIKYKYPVYIRKPTLSTYTFDNSSSPSQSVPSTTEPISETIPEIIAKIESEPVTTTTKRPELVLPKRTLTSTSMPPTTPEPPSTFSEMEPTTSESSETPVIISHLNADDFPPVIQESDESIKLSTLSLPKTVPVQLHPIPQPVSIVTKPNLARIRDKKPASLSQTTFSHNNNNNNEIHESDNNLLSPRQGIPTCCNFSPDVNDGFTHHCRNSRMDATGDGITYTPTWKVPTHFMTRDNGDSFLLNSIPLNCGPGRFQFQGFIHNFEQERAKSPGEKKHGILADGVLKYDNEFYGTTEYCINGLSPRIVEVLICKPDCSMKETPCLKKCCGLDEVYNLGLTSGNRGCQPLEPNESRFSPTLYKDMRTPLSPEEMKNIQVHFVQKFPPGFQHTCYNKITLAFPFSKEIAEKLTPADSSESGVAFKHLNFRFRTDGKLMYTYPVSDGTSYDSVYDRGEFCVDAVRDYGETDYEGGFSVDRNNQTILFICASEPH